MTLAERKLIKIHSDQSKIFQRIEDNNGDYIENELELNIRNLITDYESFLAENPNDVYCLILYGKLLRKIDRPEDAQLLYLKANNLDPNIAVIKQQLGNYHAEVGNYEEALGYILMAIDLSPETGLYVYQLGELLHHFRDRFLTSGMFDGETLDQQMCKAFSESARLDPENIDFQFRYAECFYDLKNPDWTAALKAWNNVSKSVNSEIEVAAVHLHIANIYIKLGEPEKARENIDRVKSPELVATKEQLLKQLQ